MSQEILKRVYYITKHSKLVGLVLNESLSVGNKSTKDYRKVSHSLVKKGISNKISKHSCHTKCHKRFDSLCAVLTLVN